jgi:hypothetical protein
MKLSSIARALGMGVPEVYAACKALDIPHEGSLTELKPSQALEIVGWLEGGRFEAIRMEIQRSAQKRYSRCPACGEPESPGVLECAKCGRHR